MDTKDIPSIGRFRPTSWADFKTYAGNLAWLLEIENSRATELLSRIYGYANAHELQAVLKTKGEFGFEQQEGDDRFEAPQRNHDDRVLHLAAQELGLEGVDITRRVWLSRDCEFFGRPGEHRVAFREIKRQINVSEGTAPSGVESDATEYAMLVDREHDGRVHLQFTESGRAIFGALMDAIPDSMGGGGREGWQDQMVKVESLIARYPSNPWVHAAFVCSFAEYYFQGDWSQNLAHSRESGAGYSQADAHPGFVKYARENSGIFLAHAKRGIELFDQLLEGKGDRHTEHNLSSGREVDNFYYPALLYFGAYVAANAGDVRLAIQWAQRNQKLVDGDNFGVRYLLGPLYLNEGRATSAIKKLFPLGVDYCDAVGHVCVAASAASYGNADDAVKHLGRALEMTWAPVELFSAKWAEARTQTKVMSNHDAPAFFQEWRHRSAPFWERETRVAAFFRGMANDKALREVLLSYHVANSGLVGVGLVGHEEAAPRYRAEEQAKRKLRQLMPALLTANWQKHMA
ncbi:hypothetical protein [Polaromonas sp.]|uniref:hypothetical protein n=1 Tax=Polaromonas sp. TaxID=1869339 RepID=UPI00352B37A1